MPLRSDPLLDRLEPIRRLSRNRVLGYGTALASVALATLLRFALGDPQGMGACITFYPAVIITAIVGRFWPGILSVLLAALSVDCFFIHPADAFALTSPEALAFAFNLTLIVSAIGLLHAALDRLSQQQSNLRFVIDTEQVGLIGVDDAGAITLANRVSEQQFGYTQQELIGKQVDLLVPKHFRLRHAGHRASYMRHTEERAMGAGRDLFGLRKNGTEFPVEVGLNPIVRDGRRGALATVLDISERKSAERRQQILVHEVQHRARNLLSVVQAIAMMTFTEKTTIPEARKSFLGTIHALGHTLDLFARKGDAHLKELVEAEFAPFPAKVSIYGDDISLTPQAAQNFTLIVHELCTNATKHGALSRPDGRVSVEWRQEGELLHFFWLEHGGPSISVPKHQGFGETILRSLAKEFCDEVVLEYPPSGFFYRIKARYRQIAAQDAAVLKLPDRHSGQMATPPGGVA
jgi:PAS domain S-box-containing protein